MLDDIKIIHLKSNAQRLETWIAMLNGDIVGHIYMEREENDKIKFLDAWVHEEHRLKGVFRRLWDVRWEYVKNRYSGHTVYAWCKPGSLPLLLEKGFTEGEICTYVEKVIE
jgi:hypothetical protein